MCFYIYRINLLIIVCFKYQFSAKTTPKWQLFDEPSENVSMMTCRFYSFDNKFLDEIKTFAKSHISVNAGLITSKCP